MPEFLRDEAQVVDGRPFAFDDRDFRRVCRMIHARAGIHLGAHKRDMVYSRLVRRLRARGGKLILCGVEPKTYATLERSGALDLLGENVELDRASPGDLVVVFQSGAYGRTASPRQFLGHPDVIEALI